MKIDIDKLIECKFPLEAYLVCWCLYNEDVNFIYKYISNVSNVSDNIYNYLLFNKYIEYSGNTIPILNTEKGTSSNGFIGGVDIKKILLTDKFAKEFMGIIINKNLNFDECFQQLREYYPIKAGNSERRLQGNIDKCKKLYQFTIMKNGKIDEQLHNIILQCINFEINLRTKNRSLEYFQALATWLSKKTWELYKEEVQVLVKEIGWVDKNRSDELKEDRL